MKCVAGRTKHHRLAYIAPNRKEEEGAARRRRRRRQHDEEANRGRERRGVETWHAGMDEEERGRMENESGTLPESAAGDGQFEADPRGGSTDGAAAGAKEGAAADGAR